MVVNQPIFSATVFPATPFISVKKSDQKKNAIFGPLLWKELLNLEVIELQPPFLHTKEHFKDRLALRLKQIRKVTRH